MWVYFSMCLDAASPHESSSMVSGVVPARVWLLDREDCAPSLAVEEGDLTRTISFMRVKSDSVAMFVRNASTKTVCSVLGIRLQLQWTENWLNGEFNAVIV